VFLQDLFVEPAHRRHGIAAALIARVAALASELGSPIVELTVRADNASAQTLYNRAGFQPLPQCLTYVLAGPALDALARADRTGNDVLALAG
jgi:ribosomal protein S18 acetylase RimI-like enzyme